MNRSIPQVVFLLLFQMLLSPAAARAQEVYDPWEGFNRAVFRFNDGVDTYFLEPLAKGYRAATPDSMERGIGSFFENLAYPKYLVSDLLQFKFGQALEHTGRFLVNSTLGIVGFVDVAEDLGLAAHREDLGVTMGYYGLAPGPYIVLPLIGPSNLRDTVGRCGDFFLDPLWYIRYSDLSWDEQLAISAGTTALDVIQTRAGVIDAVSTAKESAVDYYLFMRSAYQQIRQNLIYDDNPPEQEEDDDFYDEPPVDSTQNDLRD